MRHGLGSCQPSSKRSRTQTPLTGRRIHWAVRSALPVYRRLSRAASCRLDESVAEIGVNEASCYIGASNLIPVFLPPLQGSRSFGNCRIAIGETGVKWTVPALEIALCQSGPPERADVGRSPESGPVSRSVPVLVLCCRPGRSPGPGRLTPKMGAGNHPGQDANPTTHRLTLLCVVRWRSPLRRRPAIGRWSPHQLVHLSAICRDSSDPGSRRRVCTIATRNKTSHPTFPISTLQGLPQSATAIPDVVE